MPEIRGKWRDHVEASLHANGEMIKALDAGLDGPIAHRVHVIVFTLRVRSAMIEYHPKERGASTDDNGFRRAIREMFLGNVPRWAG